MTNTGETFGFKAEDWEAAKREGVCAIVRAGRREVLITYSDLARAISSIKVEPHDFAMNLLLDQISKEENAAGRGILTALVVLKDGGVPAEGFWASAADIGRNTKDKVSLWASEVQRVFRECKVHPLCP